jgi:protocatechuate 3,4-dioxygenase beta subunit
MNDHRHPEPGEIVITVRDREADLEASIRRLHAHLQRPDVAAVSGSWPITIVDNASTDSTTAIGRRLARDLDGVHLVQLRDRHTRRELRAGWRSSTAGRIAFADVTPTTDLDALLAPLLRHRSASPAGPSSLRPLSRRTALASVGAVGLGAVLAACGADTRSASGDATTTTTTAPGSTTSSSSAAAAGAVDVTDCTLATEMTQGPYYLDLDLVRRDITEGRPGAPLTLVLQVVGSSTCAPIEGAAVDIWHTDATGLYSGFASASATANGGSSGTDDGTFMRGTQITDADGKVTFRTIYPGWYRGRTVHIHVMVHAGGQIVHTGQLFFDDATTDAVFASTEPYSTRGGRDTRNANDSIYSGGGAASTLAPSASAPYSAALTMGVKA